MIKTCPLCGAKPEVLYRKQFKEFFVQCTNSSCSLIACRYFSTKDDKFIKRTAAAVLEAWNKTVERKDVPLTIKEV